MLSDPSAISYNHRAAIRSALGGAEVVGAASREARPLRDWPPVETELLRHRRPAPDRLRPALRRVLPRLLAAVDGPVEHQEAVPHHLVAAPGGPGRLEHAVTVPQVAD